MTVPCCAGILLPIFAHVCRDAEPRVRGAVPTTTRSMPVAKSTRGGMTGRTDLRSIRHARRDLMAVFRCPPSMVDDLPRLFRVGAHCHSRNVPLRRIFPCLSHVHIYPTGISLSLSRHQNICCHVCAERTHPAPAAGEFACVPETGWNSSIWNPHVFEPAAAATGLGVTSRTGEGARRVVSPQEEVLRQQAVAIVFSRFQARRQTRAVCDSCLLPATPTVAGCLFRLLRELGGQGGGAKDRAVPGNPCVMLRARGLII